MTGSTVGQCRLFPRRSTPGPQTSLAERPGSVLTHTRGGPFTVSGRLRVTALGRWSGSWNPGFLTSRRPPSPFRASSWSSISGSCSGSAGARPWWHGGDRGHLAEPQAQGCLLPISSETPQIRIFISDAIVFRCYINLKTNHCASLLVIWALRLENTFS